MPQANRWIVLAAVIAADLPVTVDMTILHIAVPSLTLTLGATNTTILWIIDAYPLVMAGLLVPMGTLGDRIGYRRVMLVGLGVFTAASVMAAFSLTTGMLIASRALLAVGGSMIMPTVLAVIRQTFDDENERATALGIWAVVGSAGGAIGPLAGGILLEHFWWGAVFLVNVPIMGMVLPLAFRFLPYGTPNRAIEWHIGQALVLIIGLVATVYAVKSGVKGDAPFWQPLLALATGLGLLVWFTSRQTTSASSMLDLSLFRRPVLTAGLVMAFVSSGVIAGFELVLAQELQFAAGMSPLDAGFFMMPLAVAAAVSGPLAGRLIGLVGLRWLVSVGLLIASTSLASLAAVNLSAQTWLFWGLLIALGLSLGSALLAGSMAVMGGVPKDRAGAAGALEGTSYELGGALGITFFGVLMGVVYRSTLDLQDSPMAGSSVGEAVIAASRLEGDEAATLIHAASSAFTVAYEAVLQGAAIALFGLAVVVFIVLRGRTVNAAACS